MRKTSAALLFVLAFASSTLSQELSTDVYPSEDELHEALLAGDLDSLQYVILLDIVTHGIDSTNRFLLDEIPNLSHFLPGWRALITGLEREQETPFRKPPSRHHGWKANLRYRYAQQISENGRARDGTAGVLRLNEHWRAGFNLRRDYGGHEHFAGRSIRYRNNSGTVRELELGSFSTRLGLGTVFGHRGRILNPVEDLSGESFLFPNNGGFNGFRARVEGYGSDLDLLASISRDSVHRLVAAGVILSANGLPLRPGVIVSVNRLTNRVSDRTVDDLKYGLTIRHEHSRGYAAMELCAQAGKHSPPSALVVEGRHHFESAQLRFAGWAYSDHFLDLTAGSKAAGIQRKMRLDEVDFEYSAKRPGQEGGLIKSIVLLTSDIELVNSFLYAGINRDTADYDLLSALVRRFRPGLSIQVDYLSRTRKRVRTTGISSDTERRIRLETRFTTGNTSIRSYIGHHTQGERPDFLSAFLSLQYESQRLGRFEIWSNLSRFDPGRLMTDYWYLYLKSEQPLQDNLTAAVKFSRTYRRGSDEKHTTVASIELRVWM
ncbi:MAG: hypothetical protein KAU35_07685 [candidate division Zixibacteria bacterium]|nr:hypothetical protein [candidate division Zixibacteria bacterium]